jgi:hypothetical protein
MRRAVTEPVGGVSAKCRNLRPTSSGPRIGGLAWVVSIPEFGRRSPRFAGRAGGSHRAEAENAWVRRQQAREDRDLRCSPRPFTASRVVVSSVYPPGHDGGNDAPIGSATGILSGGCRHGHASLVTTATRLAAVPGERRGGSGDRGWRRQGAVRGAGASGGRRGV